MRETGMKRMIAGLLLVWGAVSVFAQEAHIQEVNGTVEIKGPGETQWKAARQGQRLERGAMISTGFRSGALIVIGNSKLRVQPLSRLSVEELAAGGKDEKVDINLRAGQVRATVQPPPGGQTAFTVRSPMATASVRGTEFEFDGLRLRVEEGRVHMSGNDGGGTYVGAGHIGRVDSESGRVAGAGETAREELAPPLPAGLGNAQEAAPKAAPVRAEIEAEFEWR
jgi:hypothetical protein